MYLFMSHAGSTATSSIHTDPPSSEQPPHSGSRAGASMSCGDATCPHDHRLESLDVPKRQTGSAESGDNCAAHRRRLPRPLRALKLLGILRRDAEGGVQPGPLPRCGAEQRQPRCVRAVGQRAESEVDLGP